MKFNKLAAIAGAVAVLGVSSGAFAAGTPVDLGNLTSYHDGAVMLGAGSPTLTTGFDYIYSFTIDPTSAFDILLSGWAGLSFTSATLTPTGGAANSSFAQSVSGSTHYLSLGPVSGASSYTLEVVGTGPVTGQSFNYQFNSVTAVPEPETLAMLLAGLGLIGVATRRRNRVSMA